MTETCPGCVGRGTGDRCVMCALPIPAALQRDRNDPSEYQPGCPGCAQGITHTHT